MFQTTAIQNKRFATRRAVARLLIAGATAVLISGCTSMEKENTITGSLPDDYRINHPIAITQTNKTFDLTVATNANAPTEDQVRSLDGFLEAYQNNGSGPITLMLPLGSSNQAAAGIVGRKLASAISKTKAGSAGVTTVFYHAPADQAIAPIRITYLALVAATNQCGLWPKDLTYTFKNKHYENFGCAYQNNLAAQIANPNDLQGPRKQTEIDATNRQKVIGDYQNGDSGFNPTINY